MERKKGFTLIELVIVLTIIGLLSSVAIPRYLDLKRDVEVAANRGWIGGVRSSVCIQLAGVELGKTTTPDPRSSTPAWNRISAESLIIGGTTARPTSLNAVGTNKWSGYYKT